jgi:hypothetical protein
MSAKMVSTKLGYPSAGTDSLVGTIDVWIGVFGEASA